jgi:hypothetical protein
MSNKSVTYSKHLWVEGKTELQTLPFLIHKNGINWPNDPPYPVYIHDKNGFDNIANSSKISSFFNSHSKITHFGIILDADDLPPIGEDNNPQNRWKKICSTFVEFIPEIQQNQLSRKGLVFNVKANEVILNDIKFGAWVMPDNLNSGMLETFLSGLISDEFPRLWEHAQTSVKIAQSYKAPFREVDLDKINLRTWLTWQNKPDSQILTAIQSDKPLLDLTHVNAQAFVDWFRLLYEL